MIEAAQSLRHELHQHPELSGHETNTQKIITSFVRTRSPLGAIHHLKENGLGVVYRYGIGGPTIVIRCELDALPIYEENDLVYRSIASGVSHKCGHDGHMAMVASLSEWLDRVHYDQGTVILLFQPAEETGKGAEQILNDPIFRSWKPDYIFALHNIPGVPMHQVIIPPGYFSATVQSLIISLKGVTSHAAEPEQGVNPSTAIADIILGCDRLNNSDTGSSEFAVLTPVHIKVGEQNYGISPGSGEIHYTIRTWSEEHLSHLKKELSGLVQAAVRQYDLETQLEWIEYFPGSINDASCMEIIKQAGRQNGLDLSLRDHPFKFGEDFGWYAKEYQCGMFGLGSGVDQPPLHNPHYDFPDELLPTGIEMFKSIIGLAMQMG